MVDYAILDTNVYVGHWEHGLYEAELAAIRQQTIIRHASVVLSELRRGARSTGAEKRVAALYRLAAVQWAPTTKDWWEAGRVVRDIGDAQGWDVVKRRAFQNDALIALTARGHGARVVTANRRDFALLSTALGVTVHAL